MPKQKIKAVIFDLGGVVVHGGYLDFIRHYVKKALTPAGKKRLAQLERQVNAGLITETRFYREIDQTFDVHFTAQQIHNLIVKKMKADKALIHFIPKLKPAKVAMFTNSIGHLTREVMKKRRIPVRKLFVEVFDSVKLHLIKPDKQAYRFVLHKLKVKPREALMVDDRADNIKGAKQIGMQGIVYKNSRTFRKALRHYEIV